MTPSEAETLLGEGEVAFARRDFVTAGEKAERALTAVSPEDWQARIDILRLLADARDRRNNIAGLAPLEEAYHLAVANGANQSAATMAWSLALRWAYEGERESSAQWTKRYRAAAAQAHTRSNVREEELACRVLKRQGEYAASIPHCETALSLATNEQTRTALTTALANLYTRTGAPERAAPLQEQLYRESLRDNGPNHPATAGMLMNLGNTYGALGKAEMAVETATQARRVFELAYGPTSRWVVSASMNEASFLKTLGRYQESEARFKATIPLLDGIAPLQAARVLNNYATLKLDTGHPRAALDLLARTQTIEASELPPQSPQSSYAHATKAYAFCALGQWQDAVSEATLGVQIRERTGEVNMMAQGLDARILAYRHLGSFEKAEQDIQTQLEVFDTPDLKRHLPTALLNAAVIALDQRDPGLAERHLARATQALAGLDDRESKHAMVDFLRARIDHARAKYRREAVERASAAFERIERNTLRAYPRTDAKAWLDSVQ